MCAGKSPRARARTRGTTAHARFTAPQKDGTLVGREDVCRRGAIVHAVRRRRDAGTVPEKELVLVLFVHLFLRKEEG